jgi:hypothetical protein
VRKRGCVLGRPERRDRVLSYINVRRRAEERVCAREARDRKRREQRIAAGTLVVRQPALAEYMAGPGNDPVQVYRTLRDLHWEFLRLRTGFELPSSCPVLPCYAQNRNRNILDFMRWPQIDRGAQDLIGFQLPKSFQTNSWK